MLEVKMNLMKIIKKRIKQNKEILKVYSIVGRDAYKEMFPNGVHEAMKNSAEEAYNENEKVVHNSKK